MIGELQVRLELHDPARNHQRLYEIHFGTNLLGCFEITIRYGPVGAGKGTVLRIVSPDREGALLILRRCLMRRRSAPRRLDGARYRTVSLTAPKDLEALRADIIAAFGPPAT